MGENRSHETSFRWRVLVQKFHFSPMQQRMWSKNWLSPLTGEILWWNFCMKIGRKPGQFDRLKLFILNKLTVWRREGDSNPR